MLGALAALDPGRRATLPRSPEHSRNRDATRARGGAPGLARGNSWALLAAALLFTPRAAAGQAPAHITVTVAAGGALLPGAEVRGGGRLILTDTTGVARLTLGAGHHRLFVWKVGFSVDTLDLVLRAGEDTAVFASVVPVAQELAPIVVRAARVETRIEEEPERIEVLAPEDVGEKSQTHPGDITNLLVEMGGIHIQPVAPGLGGAAIRVQGLPGRYTLILSDGLPLYGAEPPSFSLAQVPPLDLRQVEVIKGAATALYGPAALGGVVDLVSKGPAHARQVVLSGGSRGAEDGLVWLSRRLSDRWGYTFLGGAHHQRRGDPSGDGWTDVPGYTRAEARPRLFWTGGDGSSVLLTAGGISEDRTGGTMPGGVVPAGVAFPQTLDTRHVDAGAIGRLILGRRSLLGIRGSAMATRHDRRLGADREHDRRSTLFAEATLSLTRPRHEAVIGASAQRDGFAQRERPVFDFGFTTLSLFAEDSYTPVAPLSIQATARLDHHSRYGTFVSPRASALVRLGGDWSIRASGGSGFFAPTTLVPEVEEAGFVHLSPPGPLVAERGASASVDLGGGAGPFQLNGTLFLVRVHHPVLPERLASDSLAFTLVNAAGPIRSAGAELFGVYAREPFLVTATYSHTTASEDSPEAGRRIALPLTPRNAGGVDIAYEEDEPGESGIRLAAELFYTGRQRVEDDPYRTFTPGFATLEVLLSKRFGRVTLFANGEDLTNVRQTRWDPLLLPSPGPGGRWTTDQWAPLEGRVVRVGARLGF